MGRTISAPNRGEIITMLHATKTVSAAFIIAASCLGVSASGDYNPSLDIVPMHEIAPLDLDWLTEDDRLRDEESLPYRFAQPHESFITPGNDGIWDRDDSGRLRWRMRISSKGAPHLNFGFEHYDMPASAEMMIESVDKWSIRGPFTADDAQEGELWTPMVMGDDLFITITCNDADRFQLEEGVILTKINVGYRGFQTPQSDRGTSEACNHDVECPLCDEWWNEIPAIAMYTINGSLVCSGSMINNTSNNEDPLFMTADHCGVRASNDQALVVYWNHQNSFCRTPGSSQSGGNGNGNYNQTTAGSQFLTTNSTYDCCLIRLNSSPQESYGITYAGWSRSNSNAGGRVIHHPQTAEKRCSSIDALYSNSQYWGVNYDEGRTDYGSSGSPLFNSNRQIIGMLCCGGSFCSNDSDDYYGKAFIGHWSGLAPYLDPQGTNQQSVDTLNPNNLNTGACCWLGNCYQVEEENCNNVDGDYQGLGTTCGSVDCANPDPTGACCTGTTCSISSQANCSGTYLGDDTDCSDDPCAPDPTGACCVGTTCVITTEAGCSGSYKGDDTTCSGSSCLADTDAFSGLAYSIVGQNLVDDAEPTWTVDVYAVLGDGCRLDAVAGDTSTTKMISTTSSFYQNQYGGNTSASINPALYSAFPDLRYDSFVTIGSLDQTGNNLADIGIDFNAFENGGAIDSSDGSWFITPDDAQGDSGEFSNESCESGNGVRIARLTVRDLSASVYVEALFQGKDASGITWQATGSMSIVNDNCNVLCEGDTNTDGIVNVSDLLAVIASWGDPYDVNDLLTVIANWNCGL